MGENPEIFPLAGGLGSVLTFRRVSLHLLECPCGNIGMRGVFMYGFRCVLLYAFGGVD